MPEDTGLDLVTGAFSYTGRAIAARLLESGRRVRTLTGHPERPDPFGGEVEAAPYAFDEPGRMVRFLDGVTTLYNTYWVRFERGGTTFGEAVRNSRTLFETAGTAGVRRIVHVSITKPDVAAPLPYFRGKAQVERDLAAVGVPHSIVRPTVVFGRGDVLVNNMAWLLRRFPVFAIPGAGDYRVRPVHIDDVARLCVEAAAGEDGSSMDAVGPETFTFHDWVAMVRDAVGARAWLVHVPPALVPAATWGIGAALRDVLLTREELAGLMAELIVTDGPTTGQVAFSDWLGVHAAALGREWASEVGRHFDR
ncbi:MAG: SDR family oxidoreductase [Actinomycetota bacterium]